MDLNSKRDLDSKRVLDSKRDVRFLDLNLDLNIGSARLGSARLGSARLGSAWLGPPSPLTQNVKTAKMFIENIKFRADFDTILEFVARHWKFVARTFFRPKSSYLIVCC